LGISPAVFLSASTIFDETSQSLVVIAILAIAHPGGWHLA
jgi:hypothetical protein